MIVAQIGAPYPEVRFLWCIAAVGLLSGAVRFLLPGKMFRSWSLLGIIVGALVGYFLPTVDVEHRQTFMEARACILNVIHLAVGGAVAGLAIDIWLRPPQWTAMRQFSLSTLLVLVTATAVACASVRMYLQIRGFQP
jgi:hypothetical protein